MNPQQYIQNVITLIYDHAYYHHRLNSSYVEHAINIAGNMATTSETYPLIRELLAYLGDNHSSLVSAEKLAAENAADSPTALLPQIERLEGRWGYLKLPKAVGSDSHLQRYVDVGQQEMHTVLPVDGWIVDLRGNRGGNMWAMLPITGSLSGAEVLGYFIMRDKAQTAWGYANGASVYDGDVVYQGNNPIANVPASVPIAVLIDNNTSSSGEITLISLLGRDNLRTFGNSTRGQPTANESFQLSDGALLVLTTSLTADRTGYIYEHAIAPDVKSDDPLVEATLWLQSKKN